MHAISKRRKFSSGLWLRLGTYVPPMNVELPEIMALQRWICNYNGSSLCEKCALRGVPAVAFSHSAPRPCSGYVTKHAVRD